MRGRAKSAAILLLDQAIVSGGNFLTTVICARQLSPKGFGEFSACWLAVLFAGTGMMAAIVYPMMSKAPMLCKSASDRYLLGNAQLFVVVSTVVVLCGAALASVVAAVDVLHTAALVFATALCACFVQYQELVRRILLLERRKLTLLLSDALTATSRIALLLLVFPNAHPVEYALLLIGLSSLLGATVLARSFAPENFLSSAKDAWKLNSPTARWLMPAGLMQWTSVNFFLVLAASAFPTIMIGQLRLCQNLAALTNPVIQLAENALPIRISEEYRQGGAQRLRSYVIKTASIGALALSALVPLAWFYGENLVQLVYGVSFSEVKLTLSIFLSVQVLAFLMVPLRAALRTIGKTQLWFNAYLIATLMAVASTPVVLAHPNPPVIASGMLVATLIILAFAGYGLNGSFARNG